MDYLNFKNNVYSQNGEDGILQELIKSLRIENEDSWCVEFGAWDGKHMSNTFNLIENFGWRGVYIEGNPAFYEELVKTCQKFPRIVPILRMVSHEPSSENSLDRILSETQLESDFEILSIDIDSFDLAIWDSLKQFHPKVVVIEINSSIHPGILEWHHVDGRGNSFTSTLNVGFKKGYTLVCHTGNMIFVRNDLVKDLNLTQIQIDHPETIFDFTYLPHNPKFKVTHVIRDFIKNFFRKFRHN